MAAPIAKGVAKIADKNVTINDPNIIGNAPTKGLPSEPTALGFHLVPKRKSNTLTLSTKNVASPLLATKKKIDSTTTTISAIHKKLMIFPNCSIRARFDRFVNSCFISSKRVPPQNYFSLY